jgi:hypothetical protein
MSRKPIIGNKKISLRMQKMEMQKKPVIGFKQQGIHKKLDKLSPNQLRTMFPLLGHLSDVELKREAIKELLKR